jgi:CHASE2 domain-containing sensor protein
MTKIPPIFIFLFLLFSQCKNPLPSVNLVRSADPDIVLINIEEGDRRFIGKVLSKLDSLHPILIGVDVLFLGQKKPSQDSILVEALKKIKNDILVYELNKNNTFGYSDPVFTRFAFDQGLLHYEKTLGLISHMIPLQKIEGKIHESFAFKIVKYWKPDFKPRFEVNQRIPINYQRSQKKFLVIEGSDLININITDIDLRNNIFLVGYLGPGNEDKYRTPLRLVGEELEQNEPDTYGVVIVANQIRSILEYNN